MREKPELIYIAAPYEQKELARLVARVLSSLGHRVTSFWHEQTDPVPADLHARLANRDLHRVRKSTRLLCLNPDDSKTGGTTLEVGVAIGCKIPVTYFAPAESKNLLLSSAAYHFETGPIGANVYEALSFEDPWWLREAEFLATTSDQITPADLQPTSTPTPKKETKNAKPKQQPKRSSSDRNRSPRKR